MKNGNREFRPWIPVFLAGCLTVPALVSGCGLSGGGQVAVPGKDDVFEPAASDKEDIYTGEAMEPGGSGQAPTLGQSPTTLE